MFIDTSLWKADHPGWTWNKNDAVYKLTPGDNSSRLSSGRIEVNISPGETKTISLSAEVLGGHGMLYVRGYEKDGGNTTISRGGRDTTIDVSVTLDDQFSHYEMLLGAFPDRDSFSADHGVINPEQVITFRNVSEGRVPVYGEVKVVEAPVPVAAPIVTISAPRKLSLLERVLARYRR